MQINEIQNQIIEEFKVISHSQEEMLYYLIELGQSLPTLSEKEKIEKNTISGCMSSVWVICSFINNRLFFQADSNTAITKGLISLLVRIWSNQLPKDILNTTLYCIDRIGMYDLIGMQRASGLEKMVKHIKLFALMHLPQHTAV